MPTPERTLRLETPLLSLDTRRFQGQVQLNSSVVQRSRPALGINRDLLHVKQVGPNINACAHFPKSCVPIFLADALPPCFSLTISLGVRFPGVRSTPQTRVLAADGRTNSLGRHGNLDEPETRFGPSVPRPQR